MGYQGLELWRSPLYNVKITSGPTLHKSIYVSSLFLKVILGGKNCNSTILFMRLRVMQNPIHTPNINVKAVMNMTATTNISNTVINHAGKLFIQASNVSIIR